MSTKHTLAVTLGLLATTVSFSTQAKETQIVAAESAVTAEFSQIGVPVIARFRSIAGKVNFDPKKPAEASAHFDIDTSSLDVGDELYNGEVRKRDWFNSAQFPKATLDAQGLTAIGNDHYTTTATLTFKGRVKKITIPVSVHPDILNLVFDGSVPVSRKEFSLGDPGWNEVLEDMVLVNFHIAIPAPH